jgi:hypothetical protein
MNIIKGRILSQPRMQDDRLIFDLQSGEQTFTVIRRRREDQMRDILFLCVGQEVVLCAAAEGDCMIADKIRITDYAKRQYILLTNGNGEKNYGDSTDDRTEPGDSGL